MALDTVTLTISSEKQTQQLADMLTKLNLAGSVWLSGDLGVGKTTLTRYWLQALGHQGSVKSPTYTLVEPYQIYQNNGQILPVYHADLYRLQDPEELSFIGFDEYLDDPTALIIIEWASRADDYLPEPILFIDITYITDTTDVANVNQVQSQDIEDSINSDTTNKATRQVILRLSKAGLAKGYDLASIAL